MRPRPTALVTKTNEMVSFRPEVFEVLSQCGNPGLGEPLPLNQSLPLQNNNIESNTSTNLKQSVQSPVKSKSLFSPRSVVARAMQGRYTDTSMSFEGTQRQIAECSIAASSPWTAPSRLARCSSDTNSNRTWPYSPTVERMSSSMDYTPPSRSASTGRRYRNVSRRLGSSAQQNSGFCTCSDSLSTAKLSRQNNGVTARPTRNNGVVFKSDADTVGFI